MKNKLLKIIICSLMVLNTVSTNVFADSKSTSHTYSGGLLNSFVSAFDDIVEFKDKVVDGVDAAIGISSMILAGYKIYQQEIGIPLKDGTYKIDFKQLFTNISNGIKNIVVINEFDPFEYLEYEVNMPTKFGSESITIGHVYAEYDDKDNRFIEIDIDEDFLSTYHPEIHFVIYDDVNDKWLTDENYSCTVGGGSIVLDVDDGVKMVELYADYKDSSGIYHSLERIYTISN